MNAHIESFYATLERDCYLINEFSYFLDVYKTDSEYMNYYDNKYRHGSLGDIPTAKFYELARAEKIVADPALA